MPRGVLKRCDLCGKFHASFLVEDEALGRKLNLCMSCWKAKYGGGQKPKEEDVNPKSDDNKLKAD